MSRYFCNKAATLLFSNKNTIAFADVHSPLFTESLSTTVSAWEISPTIDYLVTNCGLSPKSAISVSKKIKLKTTKKSDSVLQLLKDYGFSSKQIALAITKYPPLLSMRPEVNLKPKLEFFRRVGFEDPELADVLSTTPILFNFSLEKTMIPSLDFMKTYLPSRTTIVNFLKYGGKFLLPERAPNIEILRSRGVPEDVILKMFMSRPRSLLKNVDTFAEAVENAEKFGLHPSNAMFIRAIDVRCYMAKSTWERKIELYKSLGWSDDQIRSMFVRTPYCFAFSDELIKKKMDFFIDKLGWDPEFVANKPVVLQFSIEKRFIPRCSVLNILMSKGFIKKNTRFRAPFLVSDKSFSKDYVKKYEKGVPEVVQAYQRKTDFKGWT